MDLSSYAHLWDRERHAYRLRGEPGRTGDVAEDYLVVDLWRDVLHRYDNDDLARALISRMLAEGVPVLDWKAHVTRPVSPLRRLLEDVEAGRITWPEYYAAVRELEDDPVARRAWIVANRLDQ
jgi:hypothetical protein